MDVDVFFGGFDGGNDMCDKDFDWMVILGGGVFDVVEEKVYAIKIVSKNKYVLVKVIWCALSLEVRHKVMHIGC